MAARSRCVSPLCVPVVRSRCVPPEEIAEIEKHVEGFVNGCPKARAAIARVLEQSRDEPVLQWAGAKLDGALDRIGKMEASSNY